LKRLDFILSHKNCSSPSCRIFVGIGFEAVGPEMGKSRRRSGNQNCAGISFWFSVYISCFQTDELTHSRCENAFGVDVTGWRWHISSERHRI